MNNSIARVQPTKSFNHIPKEDNLPLAIGANFHDDPINRSTLRKSHNLFLPRYENHVPQTEYNFSVGSKYKQMRRDSQSDEESEEVWSGWCAEEISASDVKSFVVRMLAYFIENVNECPTEEKRVRYVCIKFFLEDNSVSIIEAKEDNSGIFQGVILSRRQVPKELENPDNIFMLNDFELGSEVKIYGVSYNIADFDMRSRRFFKEYLGKDIPPPQKPIIRDASPFQQPNANATRVFTSDDMDWKRVIEQQLTGIYSKHSNEDIVIAQQFLKNKINEHLSYFAIWDDRGNISSDLRMCILYLFLENCAIEVIEQRPENSGRSGSAVLIGRQRIPKAGIDLSRSRFQEHTFGKLMKSDYLGPQDLQIGETCIIFGKPFFIYGCDEKTREHVKANFNLDLKPNIDISPFMDNDRITPKFYPPPPNEFGSEREKRDNWLTLSGKPARQDQEKASREAGRIMNFSARFVKPLVKGDEAREFVITFYRETNELEINEKVFPNSGFWGGRFLAKGKHKKMLENGTTVPFEADDFVVGSVVTICQRPFFLYGMDERTTRILKGTDKLVTEEKIKNLVLLFKQQLSLKYKKANVAFLALAPEGILGCKQLKDFLRTCSCDVTDEEALLTILNLCPNGSGTITYNNFLHLINAGLESMDEASFTSRSMRTVNMSLSQSQKDLAHVNERILRGRQLKALLKEKVLQRKGPLQELFRLFSGYSKNLKLSRESFRQSLNIIMHFNVPACDEDMLISMLFDGAQDDNGEITFKQFQDFIEVGPNT